MDYAIQDMLKREETISLNLKLSSESRRFGKRYRLKNVKNIYLVVKIGLSEENTGNIELYITNKIAQLSQFCSKLLLFSMIIQNIIEYEIGNFHTN